MYNTRMLASPKCLRHFSMLFRMGRPHKACLKQGIPIIVVRENRVEVPVEMHESFRIVENYWEVAGILAAMKAGVSPESVRRPLRETEVLF